MNPFAAVVDIILSFYTSVVLMRFFLQYFRADYYNPISQLVVKATDPFIRPLRKIIPGFGGIDVASLVLAWLVIITKILFVMLLMGQLSAVHPVGLLVTSIFDVILSAIWLYMFLIIVRAIYSWIAPAGGYNPAIMVFSQLTEPFLGKIRRLLPSMEGFDLSPMIGLLVLFFVSSSISYYLIPLVSRLLIS